MSKRVVEIRHVGKKDDSEEQLKGKQELLLRTLLRLCKLKIKKNMLRIRLKCLLLSFMSKSMHMKV